MLSEDGRDKEGKDDDSCPTFHGGRPAPPVLRYVPFCVRYHPSEPIEATGLALDMFTRSFVSMSSLFLGPALLKLASDAARQSCPDGLGEACDDVKVYGFRPSSLLTNIAAAAGLLSSITLPLIGAIVDHTHYRRQVGAYTAFVLSTVKGIEIMVGPSTWFFVAIFQVVSSQLYNVHVTATYAYTSDLSSNPRKQAQYNSFNSVMMFIGTLIFSVLVLTTSKVLGTDDVGTARISQVISCATSMPLFYFCWNYLFRDCPALREIPDGMSLLTCGFRKVLNTSIKIIHNYTAFKWLLIGITFGEAAASAIVTVSTTFMAQVMEMDTTEIGLALLTAIVMGIPGSILGRWIAVKIHNPVTSAILCHTFFILTTVGAALVLKGPKQKNLTFCFSGLWGMAIGWMSPMHTTAVISILPRGQEAELMGVYILCTTILSWLPPLIFTVLNEQGVDMSIGMLSLSIYFFLAIVFFRTMGDYNRAMAQTLTRHQETQTTEIEAVLT